MDFLNLIPQLSHKNNLYMPSFFQWFHKLQKKRYTVETPNNIPYPLDCKLHPQGSIFQNRFLGEGRFKKSLKKWTFWAKSGGLFKKKSKNWTFHITWGSIQELGSIIMDTVWFYNLKIIVNNVKMMKHIWVDVIHPFWPTYLLTMSFITMSCCTIMNNEAT